MIWIPLATGPWPENGVDVLVCTQGRPDVSFARRYHDEWIYTSTGMAPRVVDLPTHWMPVPEAVA